MTSEADTSRFRLGRFAPSTSGRAHPGTLLAALLCWLDARSVGADVLLRLEDLDRARTKEGYREGLRADLEWFGLDWDSEQTQSDASERHAERIAEWVRAGRVYACECSRAQIRAVAALAPDGSRAYPGTCRGRRVTIDDWREADVTLRLELEPSQIDLEDEGGARIAGDPAGLFGDPILRRRDGAYAYHFVSVVDDAAAGVDRVVRGRDLLPSTLVQVALQQDLGLKTPRYRHHALLLESRDDKLSKLHGAVDVRALRDFYDPGALCGALAHFVGLAPRDTRCAPQELVSGFDWSTVSSDDVVLSWSTAAGLCEVERVVASGGSHQGD